MANCGTSCAIPSCSSAPVVGFGSHGSGFEGLGSSLGGLGFGSGIGSSTSAAELGVLAGVIPKPINQVPPSETVIQPPAVVVTIPGPILSATCEPVLVGGFSPCAVGGVGLANLGSSSFGRNGFLGKRSLLGQCGNICL